MSSVDDVRAAFDGMLTNVPEEARAEHLEMFDMSKFLDDDGEVDTERVARVARQIDPTAGNPQPPAPRPVPRNYGQGRRGTPPAGGSIAGVIEDRRAAREEASERRAELAAQHQRSTK